MKHISAVVFALVVAASLTCSATNPLPPANSNSVAPQALLPGEGSPMPLCSPGNCPPPQIHALDLTAGEGSPMPLCSPGNCPPPQIHALDLTAGEGSPMPLCSPGHCPPSVATPRLTAGEGSPMPLCSPGHCPPSVMQSSSAKQAFMPVS